MVESLLTRAQAAANSTGWRVLGTFPAGHDLREFDIVYDSRDGLYYLFFTYPADAGIAYYAAPTLEELASQTQVAVSTFPTIWYPSVVIDGAVMRLFGTEGAYITSEAVSDGTPPASWAYESQLFFFPDPVHGEYDASIRMVTIEGTTYWLMAYLSGDFISGIYQDIRLAWSLDPFDPFNNWENFQAGSDSVFRNITVPSWIVNSHANPNIYEVDGRFYLGFDGKDASNKWSTGLVEIEIHDFHGSAVGGYAIGDIVQINSENTGDGLHWGDPVFLRCPDGVDRIFGSGYGNTDWACLELPGYEGSVALSDAARGGATLGDTAAGSVGLSNAARGSTALLDAARGGVALTEAARGRVTLSDRTV